MRFTIDEAKKLKLIIWDLDETFWKGTLSDNETALIPLQENIDFVKELSSRGIVNAICSKNDYEPAKAKLEEYGVWDYFVFNSINWDPKGARVENLISSMALRPSNVLFLDDNPSNLAEAEFISPEIMVAGPEIITDLKAIVKTIGKDDTDLSRLNQYRILEKKREDAGGFVSNVDFLKQSNIRIQFSKLDEEAVPRIAELIQRSNQLNFTKKRINETELRSMMKENNYDLGYVKVVDNYGMYGIVGFYALDNSQNRLDHFLFSCRTMGMGIEQYVYGHLGYPDLQVVEPVSGSVSKDEGIPEYISEVGTIDESNSTVEKDKIVSVLLKGPCDLEVLASYIEADSISLETEFNFIDSNGNQADYYNHFVNILNNNESVIRAWCNKYSFLSKEGFTTKLFKYKYDIVCLSPLMDSTLAVYSNDDGQKLAYGLYSKPVTDNQNHNSYVDKQIMTARSKFIRSELKSFSEEFCQIDYTPADIVNNLSIIKSRVLKNKKSTKIVVLLLSELEYRSKNPEYNEVFSNKHLIHKAINQEIRKAFRADQNVYLLDVNRYINNQSDYFDSINHYSKYVYYKMAKELVTFINNEQSITIGISSKTKAIYHNIRRLIYKKLFVK